MLWHTVAPRGWSTADITTAERRSHPDRRRPPLGVSLLQPKASGGLRRTAERNTAFPQSHRTHPLPPRSRRQVRAARDGEANVLPGVEIRPPEALRGTNSAPRPPTAAMSSCLPAAAHIGLRSGLRTSGEHELVRADRRQPQAGQHPARRQAGRRRRARRRGSATGAFPLRRTRSALQTTATAWCSKRAAKNTSICATSPCSGRCSSTKSSRQRPGGPGRACIPGRRAKTASRVLLHRRRASHRRRQPPRPPSRTCTCAKSKSHRRQLDLRAHRT